MQVKKFEARTMKEALEMVKKELGPEAIILGARDNRKSYGLVGEGSVEITAAITEEVLQKKKFTESKMRPQDREKFNSSPARVQKQVMEKFVNRYNEENQPVRAPTRTRYIEIEDQESQLPSVDAAQTRIKSAAERAWSSLRNDWQEQGVESDGTPARFNQASDRSAERMQASPASGDGGQAEIQSLKSELAGLKQVLSQFQNIPQTLVGSHPGAEYGLSYDFSPTFEKLVQTGITPETAGEILGIAQKQMPPIRYKNKALVDAWTARYILDSTQIVGEKQLSKVQLFVGPSGAGKTSSMVKLAAHTAMKSGKKVALLTADTFKVGAVEQMRTYAQILNVPFAVVRKSSDWSYLLTQLSGYDLILCDYPGMSLKNVEEISTLRGLLPSESAKAEIHLVLPSTARNQDLNEIGKRFKVSGFTDVIFTALDESTQHGCLYNFMRHFSIPLHSFGVGSRVPEDFEMATRERVLDLIFKLTKMKKVQE